MEVSLTELRQRLFELADRVLETGEAIVITRRGRTLRIVRDDAQPKVYSRLAKLRPQPYEIGPDLDPHESPARWSELDHSVNETAAVYAAVESGRRRPPSKRETLSKATTLKVGAKLAVTTKAKGKQRSR